MIAHRRFRPALLACTVLSLMLLGCADSVTRSRPREEHVTPAARSATGQALRGAESSASSALPRGADRLPPTTHPVVAVDPRQSHCLALSMYWEAKGEGEEGMRAVGHVVLNRASHRQFPETPCDVVYEGGEERRCQFSWYCDGRSDRPREMARWAEAQALADRLLRGELVDITDGSLFFHAKRLETPWAVPRTRTVVVGNHVFYK